MTLREKILLAAMGAAVMGGGIQFGLSTLLPSPAPSGTDSSLQPVSYTHLDVYKSQP